MFGDLVGFDVVIIALVVLVVFVLFGRRQAGAAGL